MSRLRILIPAVPLFLAALHAGAAPGFKFFNAAVRDSIPATISGTGMYKDILNKVFSDDVVPFEVNAPLWTDGAIKARFIVVPPGKSIDYSDTSDVYGYPDSTVVMKNFSVERTAGDPSSRILVETRFTMLKKSGAVPKWYLFSYHWRADQTDADLVSLNGENFSLPVHRQGASGPESIKKWKFPSPAQCAACHRIQSRDGRVVLAFFTAQLNRPYSGNTSINQLAHFFDIGLLKAPGARPDFTKSPKWARWDDQTASLDLRARSYIASNCSGCHGDRGMRSGATVGATLNYDYHDMAQHMDFVTKKLSGTFPIDSAGLVVPGRPDRSVLLFRQVSRNATAGDFDAGKLAMPPLGSYEPDTNAIKVLTSWIAAMPVASIHGGLAGHQAADGFLVRDGRIYVPASLDDATGKLVLMDLQGRAVPLVKMEPGIYRIQGKTAPGVHLLLWNGRILRSMVL
jgi:hypothetical protein